VYKAFLEELQFYGYLVVADVQKIFANLSELVELSMTVASDLFKLFDSRSGDMIAPANELILAFSMFGHKWNPVYQRFCVNMEQQRGFVKALQQLPDFQEYIAVCKRHPMVQRSDLMDFLIAPMQHQCHYQLLLENVLKVTYEPAEKSLLTSAIKAFVVALKELQANITAQHRSEELLELQETLSWPSLASLCPDSYIPESLSLEQQPCRQQLASTSRQLLRGGALRLIDSRGRHAGDIQLFLFTDMLLLGEPHCKSSRRELARREVRPPLAPLSHCVCVRVCVCVCAADPLHCPWPAYVPALAGCACPPHPEALPDCGPEEPFGPAGGHTHPAGSLSGGKGQVDALHTAGTEQLCTHSH
jgi:hypothetical protein